jgi:hypothetical protein
MPGALDANGIWIYDETDLASPFSDYSNLLAESTSDEIANDRARLTALEAGGAAGTYTPTLTNATVGNGTLVGRQAKVGAMTWWQFIFTLGSTSTVTGALTVTCPFTPAAGMLVIGSGYVGRGTATTNRVTTTLRLTTGSNVWVWYNGGNVSATSPLAGGTWQAADVIAGSGMYLS